MRFESWRFTYCQMGRVVQRLLGGEPLQQMALTAKIRARILEQAHRHGHAV